MMAERHDYWDADIPWEAQQEYPIAERFYATPGYAEPGNERHWYLADRGRYKNTLLAHGFAEDEARTIAEILNAYVAGIDL